MIDDERPGSADHLAWDRCRPRGPGRSQAVSAEEDHLMAARISYADLAALPTAPYWARRHARAVLNSWQLWSEVIETAELLISELVTNALAASYNGLGKSAYSGPDDTVKLSLTMRLLSGRVVIEVSDSDPNPPVLVEADLESESGRGLMLVQALSKEWGYFSPPTGGKTVYCVIGAPGLADNAETRSSQ